MLFFRHNWQKFVICNVDDDSGRLAIWKLSQAFEIDPFCQINNKITWRIWFPDRTSEFDFWLIVLTCKSVKRNSTQDRQIKLIFGAL